MLSILLIAALRRNEIISILLLIVAMTPFILVAVNVGLPCLALGWAGLPLASFLFGKY